MTNSATHRDGTKKTRGLTLPYHRESAAFEQSKKDGLATSTDLDQLLRDRWLEAHPNHRRMIDELRSDERRQKESDHREKRKAKKRRNTTT